MRLGTEQPRCWLVWRDSRPRAGQHERCQRRRAISSLISTLHELSLDLYSAVLACFLYVYLCLHCIPCTLRDTATPRRPLQCVHHRNLSLLLRLRAYVSFP